MKKIHLLYAVFALLATGFSSCEDLLTEEPNSKYDRDRYSIRKIKRKCQ